MLDVGQRTSAVAREIDVAELADVTARTIDRVAGDEPRLRRRGRKRRDRGKQAAEDEESTHRGPAKLRAADDTFGMCLGAPRLERSALLGLVPTELGGEPRADARRDR